MVVQCSVALDYARGAARNTKPWKDALDGFAPFPDGQPIELYLLWSGSPRNTNESATMTSVAQLVEQKRPGTNVQLLNGEQIAHLLASNTVRFADVIETMFPAIDAAVPRNEAEPLDRLADRGLRRLEAWQPIQSGSWAVPAASAATSLQSLPSSATVSVPVQQIGSIAIMSAASDRSRNITSTCTLDVVLRSSSLDSLDMLVHGRAYEEFICLNEFNALEYEARRPELAARGYPTYVPVLELPSTAQDVVAADAITNIRRADLRRVLAFTDPYSSHAAHVDSLVIAGLLSPDTVRKNVSPAIALRDFARAEPGVDEHVCSISWEPLTDYAITAGLIQAEQVVGDPFVYTCRLYARDDLAATSRCDDYLHLIADAGLAIGSGRTIERLLERTDLASFLEGMTRV